MHVLKTGIKKREAFPIYYRISQYCRDFRLALNEEKTQEGGLFFRPDACTWRALSLLHFEHNTPIASDFYLICKSMLFFLEPGSIFKDRVRLLIICSIIPT